MNKKIINSVKNIMLIIFRISITFGLLYLIYWLGIKGTIGILLGFTLMSLLIATKNPIFMLLVKKVNATWYTEELKKK